MNFFKKFFLFSLILFPALASAQQQGQGTCLRYEDITTQVPITTQRCHTIPGQCFGTYCTQPQTVCEQVVTGYTTVVTGRRCVQWSNPQPPVTPTPPTGGSCIYNYNTEVYVCDYTGCGNRRVSGVITCSPGTVSVTVPSAGITLNCSTCSASSMTSPTSPTAPAASARETSKASAPVTLAAPTRSVRE